MFSPWDECVYGCKCPKCLERQKAHEEMMKDMTWEKYGMGIKITSDMLKLDVPRKEKINE